MFPDLNPARSILFTTLSPFITHPAVVQNKRPVHLRHPPCPYVINHQSKVTNPSIPMVGAAGEEGVEAVDLLKQDDEGELVLHGVAA